jgi:addiction module HigA family antidote
MDPLAPHYLEMPEISLPFSDYSRYDTVAKGPMHPGRWLVGFLAILRNSDNEPLTQQEFADGLGVSRQTISLLLHGRRAVSAQMALLLQAALPCTSAAEWLAQQGRYDLFQAQLTTDVSNVRVLWNGASRTS